MCVCVKVCIYTPLVNVSKFTQADCHVLLQALLEEKIKQLIKDKDGNSEKEVN